MGSCVALITMVSDVSQILIYLPGLWDKLIIFSSLCSWWKGNKDLGNCLWPEREVRAKLRAAGPQIGKARPHSDRLHVLAGRMTHGLHLTSVTAACAQHPPRAHIHGCSCSRGHTAQLLQPFPHLYMPNSKASAWLQLTYFVVLDWNYSPKLLRKKLGEQFITRQQ